MSLEGGNTQIKGRRQPSRELGRGKKAHFLPSSISCLILCVLSTSEQHLKTVNAPNHNPNISFQIKRKLLRMFLLSTYARAPVLLTELV